MGLAVSLWSRVEPCGAVCWRLGDADVRVSVTAHQIFFVAPDVTLSSSL